MFTLQLTPKAESNLTDIWVNSCVESGADQADRYLECLNAGMQQLATYPSLGTDYSHVLPNYRRLLVEQHAAFYRIQDNAVIVVRVLHQQMDAPNRLLD